MIVISVDNTSVDSNRVYINKIVIKPRRDAGGRVFRRHAPIIARGDDTVGNPDRFDRLIARAAPS